MKLTQPYTFDCPGVFLLTITRQNNVGSVVEWLKRRARDQHGLG